MRPSHTLAATTLVLAVAGLPAQSPRPAFQIPALRPAAELEILRKADLLPAGKTQGTFHLTGLVRRDRSVVLRWANDAGEMPTEGVRVFRQKVGDAEWKDLTARKPLGFLQGRAALKRLEAMPAEAREDLLAYPFADIQHDPATRLRLPDLAKQAPKRARDLSPEASLNQFRALRQTGRLNRLDLQLMHTKADLDPALAEALGLAYVDEPGRGQYRYKIQIALPEGGFAEAVCPKAFNTAEPTPVPQPLNLTAASGNGEVLLNWDEAPSEVVGGYNIYRAENRGGPWTRINPEPVKHVQLDLEDPETTLRRAQAVQGTLNRMLAPLPEAARTPQKVLEAQRLAFEQAQDPATFPALSPAAAQSVKAAVAAGRLRPGGLQAAKSLYTDSLQTPGNALVNDRTYHYKVTALDIGGQEQPLDTAPLAQGMPRDLEPPPVPGRPMLQAEATARTELRAAEALRLKDTRLVALDQALAARSVKPLAGAAPAPAAAPYAALSPVEVKRMKLARTAATLPAAAMLKLGESAVLRSNPDGSVPPAQLVWAPAQDPALAGYQVHRAVGDGPLVRVADTTTASWTDPGLEAGKAYRYAVSATDQRGNVSALSPAFRLEVSDATLPARLAIGQLTGAASEKPILELPARRRMRPAGQTLASGSLAKVRAGLRPVRAEQLQMAPFQAPKRMVTPKVNPSLTLGPAAAKIPQASPAVQALAPGVVNLSAADAGAKLSLAIKPLAKVVPRSFNPMLAPPSKPRELQVQLEWGRPLEGQPLSYVVHQAPQRMEVALTPRPVLPALGGFQGFQNLTAVKPLAAPKALAPSVPAPSANPVLPEGFIRSTPLLHAQVSRGLVAVQGAGLRVSPARAQARVNLVAQGGPGHFARLNETPVTSERYGVTFPAEVAQYGGATFYYRVQALTQEFGRTVEGPLSSIVAVRLPDVVPPPSPEPGSVDLREGTAGRLKTALTWTQAAVKDLAGVLVDRQPMAYTLVEGEARPGAPSGPAARLTPAPLNGGGFEDPAPPAGYQRYTFRSVDQTGNISEPLGFLDILVPGEPVPAAPAGLNLAGNRLQWQAAQDAAGYTIWRSFTGGDDWVCISGILGPEATAFDLPAEGTLHLRVVARSASGMHRTPSAVVVRTP